MRKRAARVQHPLPVCARKEGPVCTYFNVLMLGPLAYISNPELFPEPHAQISNCQLNISAWASGRNYKFLQDVAHTLLPQPSPDPHCCLKPTSRGLLHHLLPPPSTQELRTQTQEPLVVPFALSCHCYALPGFLSISILNLLTLASPSATALAHVDITSCTDCGHSLYMGLWVFLSWIPSL